MVVASASVTVDPVAIVILEVPSNATPLIVLGVASFVALVAFTAFVALAASVAVAALPAMSPVTLAPATETILASVTAPFAIRGCAAVPVKSPAN